MNDASCHCSCFGNEHVYGEIRDPGETTVDDWITERVQAEECACRWKSSPGGCCLGTVRAAVSEAETALEVTD